MPGQIIPVIMCGGAGTRLWPVSRESMPKQFVPLVGQGSTFQQVLARVSDPELFARPIVITNADFRFVVAEQLRELRHRGGHRARADAARFRPRRRGCRRACGRTRSATPSCWCSRPITSFASPRVPRCMPTRGAQPPRKGRIVTFGIEPTMPRPITATSARASSSTAHPCARSRRSSRSPMPRPPQATSPTLSLEQRQFPVSRRDHAGRDRALRAG